MSKDFDPDKYFKLVIKQANEIKKQALDIKQIIRILEHNQFVTDAWRRYGNKQLADINLLVEAQTEMNIALEFAFSNYRKEHKSMIKSIFGWGLDKVPKFKLPRP